MHGIRRLMLVAWAVGVAAHAAPAGAQQSLPPVQTTRPLLAPAQTPAAWTPSASPVAVHPLPDAEYVPSATPPIVYQSVIGPLAVGAESPAGAARLPAVSQRRSDDAAAMAARQFEQQMAVPPQWPPAPSVAPVQPPVAAQPGEVIIAPPGQPENPLFDQPPIIEQPPLIQQPPVQGPLPPTLDTAISPWHAVGAAAPLVPYWDHGLWLESPAGDFRMHVGGLIQFEAGWFADDDTNGPPPDGTGPVDDSVQFRRARLRMEGTIYEVIDFVGEFDFVNDEVGPIGGRDHATAVTELYAEIARLPYLTGIRIGNFKEPIGLEHLTDDRFLTFMERSPGYDAFLDGFSGGYRPGIMVYEVLPNESATWALGAFKNTSNPYGFGIGGPEHAVTGRITLLPIYEAGGRYVMHLGGAASYRGLDDDLVRYRARGSVRSGPPGPLNPNYADTGLIGGDNSQVVSTECAFICGPWSFQSELTGTFLNETILSPAGPAPPTDVGTAFFYSHYFELSYFLTGENRGWDRRRAVFDRVVPIENFFCVGTPCGTESGLGAWQVAARYSRLDLVDAGVSGGKLYGVTLGLNWFLNPNMKMQLNYDIARRSNVGLGGDIHALGLRMNLDF